MKDVGRRETDGRRPEEPGMDGKHWTPTRGGLSGCPRGPRGSAEEVAVEVMSQPCCSEEIYCSGICMWCGKTGYSYVVVLTYQLSGRSRERWFSSKEGIGIAQPVLAPWLGESGDGRH